MCTFMHLSLALYSPITLFPYAIFISLSPCPCLWHLRVYLRKGCGVSVCSWIWDAVAGLPCAAPNSPLLTLMLLSLSPQIRHQWHHTTDIWGVASLYISVLPFFCRSCVSASPFCRPVFQQATISCCAGFLFFFFVWVTKKILEPQEELVRTLTMSLFLSQCMLS